MALGTATRLKPRYTAVSEAKAGGVTYTPAALARFLAKQIANDATFPASIVRVLDPAIGDGELLCALLEELKHRGIDAPEVHGFDTDRLALANAQRRLKAAFPSADIRLEHGDFLDFVLRSGSFDPVPSLFSVSEPAQPFDLVIANPPYVRTQIMGAEQAQAYATAFGLNGRVDLYHAFLVAIARVLSPSGTAGIIASNRFMTTKGGAALRAELRTRFHLRHIWDLGDTKLFSAAVLPALILARGPGMANSSAPAFTSIYETQSNTIIQADDVVSALSITGATVLPDGRRFQVQHGQLDTSGSVDDLWRITTDDTDRWLATVTKHTWRTFKGIGNIRVGVKTCADKVFIRTDWDSLPDSERPELLRPLTTHHGAGRFRAVLPTKPRRILYPHESVNGQRRPVDLAGHPKAQAYLQKHRTSLEGRAYVTEAGRQWYEIWVPQDPAVWSSPKLVFRDISERPNFWIDLDGTVVNGDCYWLTPRSENDVELLWLAAAVANSTFIEAFYDRRFNNKLYAGRRRFITQYVELFPLPDPSTPLSRDLVALAKKIYNSTHQDERGRLEAHLDDIVWEAFGLCREEVPW